MRQMLTPLEFDLTDSLISHFAYSRQDTNLWFFICFKIMVISSIDSCLGRIYTHELHSTAIAEVGSEVWELGGKRNT